MSKHGNLVLVLTAPCYIRGLNKTLPGGGGGGETNTMRYHLTPVRMLINKKNTNRDFAGGPVAKTPGSQ